MSGSAVVRSAELERCRGLALVFMIVMVGCAGRASATAAPTSPSSARASSSATPPTAELDSEAALDDELRRHEWLRDHGNEADRARALVELGYGYQRRASQLTMERFDLEQAPPEPRADLERRSHLAESDAWLLRAIASFEAVLDDPSPPAVALRSEARLGLASALTTRGDEDRAAQVLVELLGQDATSVWAGTAMLTLGDAAFMRGAMEEAAALYERTQLVARPAERLYARYKLGWVAFNLDDPATALSHWMAVVQEAGQSRANQHLANEAARDCVRAFALVGQPSKARAFFQRLSPQLAPRLLAALAEQYRSEGRPADAAIVLGQQPPPPDAAMPGATPSLGGPALQ